MFYLIITTSINNKVGKTNHNHRKNRYINSINSTLNLIKNKNIKPIIVENNEKRQTYLDGLNCDIVYTDNNRLHFKEKAVNELYDIKHVINHYKIQEDDVVIKLTGRYKILNSSFFDLVENNFGKYDSFVKFFNVCTLKYMNNDCVLGLFATKCKHIVNFNYKCIKSPEVEFATYIRNKNIYEVNNLNLECCFADNLRMLNV